MYIVYIMGGCFNGIINGKNFVKSKHAVENTVYNLLVGLLTSFDLRVFV